MDTGVLSARQPRTDLRGRPNRRPPVGRQAGRVQQAPEPAGAGDGEPARLPAVVITGAPARARSAVLRELLGLDGPLPVVPADSYLVLRHGAPRTARAYLPGYLQPQPFPEPVPLAGTGAAPVAGQPAARPTRGGPPTLDELPPGPLPAAGEIAGRGGARQRPGALPRPPRRVELTLPVPLLAELTLVDAATAGAFLPAHNKIVLDAAERAGALLVTLDVRGLPSQAELEFLAAVAQRPISLFFVAWGDGDPEGDRAGMASYRELAAGRAARLAEAPWFLVPPGSGAAELRQGLVSWAHEARRQATAVGRERHRRVPTAVDGRESGWEELLERVARAASQSVRQRLAIELANIHLRCVQDILFGTGCRGLAAALDREMHALSLRGVDEVESAVTEIIRQVLAHVLTEAPYDAVLRQVADALRRRLAEDRPDLDRTLLVISTGGIASQTGPAASLGLSAYHLVDPAGTAATGDPGWPTVLPPLGIGLSGSCYQRWRDLDEDSQAQARDGLQAAVRATELELQKLLTERFEAVQQVLGALVAEAVDHGQLLL